MRIDPATRMKMVEINGKELPIGSVIQNWKGQYGIVDERDGKAVVIHPFTKAQVEKIIGEPLSDRPLETIPGDPEAVRRTEAKIGRNDPCHCGSGKKYKKCCGIVN